MGQAISLFLSFVTDSEGCLLIPFVEVCFDQDEDPVCPCFTATQAAAQAIECCYNFEDITVQFGNDANLVNQNNATAVEGRAEVDFFRSVHARTRFHDATGFVPRE